MTSITSPTLWDISEVSRLAFEDGSSISEEVFEAIPKHLKQDLTSSMNREFFHRREVQEIVAKAGGKGVQFQIGENRVTVQVGEKRIQMEMDSSHDLKKTMFKIKNYARRAGLGVFGVKEFDGASLSIAKIAKISPEMEGDVRRIQGEANRSIRNVKPPKETKCQKAVAKVSQIIDGTTASKYLLTVIETYRTGAKPVVILGTYMMLPLLGFSSAYMIKRGSDESAKYALIGDKEGRKDGERIVWEGAALLSGTVLWGASEATATLGCVATGTALGAAAAVSFGAAGVVGTGFSTLKIARCHQFRSKLNQYLYNEALTDDQKMMGAMGFLRDQLSLQGHEILEIFNEIDALALPKEEKVDLVRDRIIKLMHTKLNRIKRRIGAKATELVLRNVEDIIRDLRNPATKEEAIERAKELISTIKHENRKRIIFYAIMLAASLFSIAALIAATIASGGLVPLVIGLIGASLYTILSVYTFLTFLRNKLIMRGSSHTAPVDALVDLSEIMALKAL